MANFIALIRACPVGFGATVVVMARVDGDAPAELVLVSEAKIGDLLGRPGDRFEASGVRLHEGSLYVVFDDTPRVLRLAPDWDSSSGARPALIETGGRAGGYEGLTFEPSERQWYCLIEASETPTGGVRPGIDVLDESFRYVTTRWLDFPVKRENKGIEGIAVLARGGEEYVLGLCEGNACKSGSAGREPGQGRVQVFRRLPDADAATLDHAGTIRLPRSVLFEDYAALDVRGDVVTVVSQVTSALWVGRLRPGPGFADPFEDAGSTYLFPRDKAGRVLYCNIEGLTWLPDGSLVVVSDRAKTDEQASRCRQRDQSIHRFRLPDAGS